MNFELIGILVLCLFGIASGAGQQDKVKLYKKVFIETEPPIERSELIGLLQELKPLYEDSPLKSERIEDALDISDVSERKCGSVLYVDYNRFGGRALQLVKESMLAQEKLCLQLWESALIESSSKVDKSYKEAVGSILQSMIEANGGKDFSEVRGFQDLSKSLAEDHFAMAHESAQEGVLRYMEKKSRTTFSKKTKQEVFDKAFNELISEPCKAVVSDTKDIANKYIRLLEQGKLVNPPVNRAAYEWAKKSSVCQMLRGYGYSSEDGVSFRQNTFDNLKYRASKGLSLTGR